MPEIVVLDKKSLLPKNIIKISLFFLIPLLVISGSVGGYLIGNKKIDLKKITAPSSPKEKHLAFLSEVYDKIKENYWDSITDEQLANIFVLGTEKLTGQPQSTKPKDKQSLIKMLTKILKDLEGEEKKKQFTVSLADIVLANLQPFGRSRLYSRKEETNLKNTVENRNPEVDQYEVLGVDKDASAKEIAQVFEQKSNEIKKESSPEAELRLSQLNKAFQALADEDNRKNYDQFGIEPTMEHRLVKPSVYYIKIDKFSPTTVQELLKVTEKVDSKDDSLNSLIVDLRDNVGGAIDGLPYFLGPFIGMDQYAYQFYHQGEKEDFKTKIGWLPGLVRYKKVVVLINENTQSSAEVMAATLKKYNAGVLVGKKTKGWGTVEKVFSIDQQIDPLEKYSMFLVHSLTLREDGQPIEGNGVEPVVNIEEKNWERNLNAYFNSPELVSAVREILNN
ncbi:hypothetical protein C4578_03135 [Candidatus Microgenomates bacterium]|jgi:hypothetical protein|nr:MAG: hypothetical protein C4578_03135 [Candidatus Microgenomates bacterium]